MNSRSVQNIPTVAWYAAADACRAKMVPNLVVCVQCGDVYAPAEVCGAGTGRNIGVCAHVGQVYASAEVCGQREGSNLVVNVQFTEIEPCPSRWDTKVASDEKPLAAVR